MFPRRSMRNIGVISVAAIDNLIDSETTPTDASVAIRFNTNGNIETYTTIAAVYATIGTWRSANDLTANYEILATLNSGSVTSGTTGSRVALTTSPAWVRTRTNNVAGSDTANITFAIYPIGALSPADSKTIDMESEVL